MMSGGRIIAPALRFSRRTLASAAVAPTQTTPQRDIVLSTEGIRVVAVPSTCPAARVSVAVRAGPRHESGLNLGVTHALRNAAYLATQEYTSFGLIRNLEQIGASFDVSTTKEYMLYTVSCMRDDYLPLAVDCLLQAVMLPEFRRWEVETLEHYFHHKFVDPQFRMKHDIAFGQANHSERCSELVLAASFGNTVGRSFYAPSYMVGHYTGESLMKYKTAHYTADRMCVVGHGVDHAFLKDSAGTYAQWAKEHVAQGEAPNDETPKFFAGEIREEADSRLAHVLVTAEGVSVKDNNVVSVALLQRILGSAPRAKYGYSDRGGKLSAAVAAELGEEPFHASGYNVNYSDTGLFGLQLITPGKNAHKALRAMFACTGALAKNGITNEELSRAKVLLKADLAMKTSEWQLCTEDLVQATLVMGALPSTQKTFELIDKTTAEDVTKIAKKLFSSKPSMAAIGDLADTPRLGELLG